ncbi:hypothetical protein [Nocardioides jiangxiensis]|uniref:WXG100 family type VII secretion target n=1 Tax=Nocardioides jiangxiensis TaxID=3064524 RepID=A0ABT9AWN1_9ACTN|nr:hypothetical protein [Nocardioides sp. WY-20]MDO7866871.1 hypothetical protein [Nocardioides sp. WY-20]
MVGAVIHHWDTQVAADPAQCRTAAAAVHRLSRCLGSAALDLAPRCDGEWTGPASTAASQRTVAAARHLSAAADRCSVLAAALDGFAQALATVCEDLRVATSVALDAGLTIDHSGFYSASDHPAAIAVRRARADEATAHAVFRSRLPKPAAPDAWTDLSRALLDAPPRGGDTAEWLAWSASQPGSLAGLPGRRLSAELEWFTRSAAASTRPFIGRAGSLLEAARPAGAHLLRELGLAGSVLTVGLDARHQWTADAAHPSMSATERSLRAGVRGAVEGGMTLAFAAGGAAALAAMPGGAYLGGTLGAWAGQRVGGAVADVAVEHVDDVLRVAETLGDTGSDVVDAVGHAAEAVDDAADAVGDAVGQASDRLCFWH